MTTATTNVIAKIAAVVAGLGLVAMSFASFAPAAKAATQAELEAQIAALMAQIAAMGGTSSSASATFTMDLTIGSSGAEVTALQNWLISKGYSIPAGATGYFGAQTQAALAAFQAANGISPAAGYFGPITRAKVNAMAGGSTSGGSTGGSTGGSSSSDEEGYLDEVDRMSEFSNEEVGEDEEDVEVLGAEMEAVDADQTIERVTVEIEIGTESGSDDLEDYISEVSLWLDGEELDRMEVDDASYDRDGGRTGNDDMWTFRFTGLDGTISEGDMGELVVAVNGVSNLDSGDATTWQVRIPQDGVRAVSPNGVDDTYVDSNTAVQTNFTVESFADANDVELRASTGDNNPEEGVAVIDNEGDEIALLEGELKAEGSDITITQLRFAVTGSVNTELIADDLTLEIDGDEFTESLTGGATSENVDFDDLDLTISEDDTVSFRLTASSATSTVNGAQGVTLDADLTVSTAGIDAEDESGEDLTSSELSGTANGETQHLFTVVPEIEVVSTDIDAVSPEDDGEIPSANATIVLDVTARGGTIYLNGDTSSTENLRFFVGQVYGSGVSASTTASSTTYTTSGEYQISGSGGSSEYYTVNEDDTMRITINSIVAEADHVTATNVLAGLKALLFQFGTSNSTEATRSAIDLNWTDLTDQTQTGTVQLRN